MSEVNFNIARMEEHAAKLKRQIQFKNMSERLAKHGDFKKLILQEFIVDECARYAQNSANPALDEAGRADSLGIAQAAGHLKRWLSVIYQMGMQAENDLNQTEEAITELRQNGAEVEEFDDDPVLEDIQITDQSVGGLD